MQVAVEWGNRESTKSY